MAFRDLREFLNEGLDLPIGGATYHVAPPSAAKGLALQRLRDLTSLAAAGVQLTDEQQEDLIVGDAQEINFYRDNLGDAYDAMLAGGVTLGEIKIAAGAAFICWTSQGDGRADAEAYWDAMQERVVPPVAPPVKKKPKKAAKASASTDGASTTQRPESGSGTSSPKARSRAPKAEAALRSVS